MERIEQLVSDFESGALPPSEFHHAQHLAVALWYVTHYRWDEAVDRFRAGIMRYLGHHDVDPTKYHETVTLFWLHAVATFAADENADAEIAAKSDRLVAAWGDAKAIRNYYSTDLLDSAEARATFVPPDLKPLPAPRACSGSR